MHDEFVRFVAGKVVGHRIEFDPELVAVFDGYNELLQEFIECKTRHEIVLREWDTRHRWVVDRLLKEAQKQVEVLVRCGIFGKVIWYFDRKDVKDYMEGLLHGVGVDEVHYVRWRPSVKGVPTKKKSKDE